MDQPIKTLINIFVTFLGVFLLLTILTFGIAVYNARNVLYTVIDYVEIAGVNTEVINGYADQTNTIINVTATEDDGIYTNGSKNRYQVEVTFSHMLAWINFKPTITLKGVTRAVDY